MKNLSKQSILFLITFALILPTSYIYVDHANVEAKAYENAKTETKKIKTMSEALLFFGIGLGYIITMCYMLLYPQNRLPYLVLLVGTVAVTILYYFRIYGIPIPFTDGIVIVDFSSDWRDVITKICQQILVIPVAILMVVNTYTRKN